MLGAGGDGRLRLLDVGVAVRAKRLKLTQRPASAQLTQQPQQLEVRARTFGASASYVCPMIFAGRPHSWLAGLYAPAQLQSLQVRNDSYLLHARDMKP